MTEEEILKKIAEKNDESRDLALMAYSLHEGEDVKRWCCQLAEETADNYNLVLSGEAPKPFGPFSCDEIARTLARDMHISFKFYSLEKAPGTKNFSWRAHVVETTVEIEAEEAWERMVFIAAYEKYLYTAAAFAKSLGAVSAMRLYLRAWGLVCKTRAPYTRLTLAPADALRVVDLERTASARLWIDVEAARLPPFKPRPRVTPAPKAVHTITKKQKG